MLRRALGALVTFALTWSVATIAALGFWSGGGTGGASASVGDLADTGAPDVDVVNGTVALDWAAADAGGSGPITYWVQRRLEAGTAWADACGTTSTSPIVSTSCTEVPGPGTFVWRVTAMLATWTDVSAASTPATVGAVDTTPPTIAITSPVAGADVRGSSITVAADANDAASGVASVQFQFAPTGSSSWFDIGSAATVAPFAVAWDRTAVADGIYQLRATATDRVGNRATSAAITVRLDDTDPSLSVTARSVVGSLAPGTPGTVWVGTGIAGSAELVATASDGGSGAASATFSATSASGWSASPSHTVSSPTGGPFTSNAYSWSAGASSVAALPVTARDRAGNTATATLSLLADAAGPVVAVSNPAPGAHVRGTITLAASVNDSGAGVATARMQIAEAGSGAWTDVGSTVTSAPWSTSWSTPPVSADYDIRVIAVDRVGNSTTSAPITVHVDNIAPAIDLDLGPSAVGAVRNGTTVWFRSNAPGSLTIVATASGASPAAGATFPATSVAGWTHAAETASTPTGGPYTSSAFSWTTGAAAPGAYTVTANDAAGNTASASLSILADATAPTGTVTAPSAGASLAGQTSLTATSTDSGSGVANVRFERAAAGTGAWSVVGTSTTSPYSVAWDTTSLIDGLYDVRAVATDLLGSSTTTSLVSVRVDNQAPTGSITAPVAAANVRGTVSVGTDSADSGAGVLSVQFQRSPAGADTWSNVSAVDTTAPYAVSWVTTTGNPDGQYDLRAITTDKAGNTATSPRITVLVDNTAPSGAITAPATSSVVTGAVTIVASSADAGSGVAAAQFQVSPRSANTWTNVGTAVTSAPFQTTWSTDALAEAQYDLRVVTTDRAGGVTTSSALGPVRVDRTAPAAVVTAPAAGANLRGSVTVSATATDTGGVAKVQFQYSVSGADTWSNLGSADTTSPYSVSWATTGVASGLYDIRAVATDKVSLSGISPSIAAVRVDNTAPTMALTVLNGVNVARVGNTVYVRSSTGGSFGLSAAVTDAGSGPAKATYPVLATTGWTHAAEVVTTPTAGPYASSPFTVAAAAVSPGTYTVTGADVAGNTVTSALTLTMDATAPTGAITAPAAAANVRGAVTVTSSSADTGSGVSSAQFQFSPAGAGTWAPIGAAVTASPFTTAWTTTSLTDGLYDLRVVTTDRVGNTSTSAAAANVRVDNTVPTATMTAPATNAVLSGTAVALAATAADSGSSLAGVQFQYTTRGGTTWTNIGSIDTTSPYTTTFNTTTVTDGLYDLRAVATDKAGNQTPSAVVPVQVKNTTAVAAVQSITATDTATRTAETPSSTTTTAPATTVAVTTTTTTAPTTTAPATTTVPATTTTTTSPPPTVSAPSTSVPSTSSTTTTAPPTPSTSPATSTSTTSLSPEVAPTRTLG